jgi:hypothetical protein
VPGLLRERHEVARRDEPARRVLPAHERLGARHPPRAQLDDRLVVQAELLAPAARDGAREVALQLHPVHHGVEQGAVEQAVAGARPRGGVAPGGLGRVHRDVGVAQQPFGREPRRAQRDAHARAHRHLAPVDPHRPAHRAHQALGEGRHVLRRPRRLDEHGELVAAEPRHRVAPARGALQAAGDLRQQAVAGAVAQRVVDRLEVVEVEQEHRDAVAVGRRGVRAAAGLGAGERVGEAVAEEGAVGQAGERVVEGLVRELRLAAAQVGDGARQPGERAAQRAHELPQLVGGRLGHHHVELPVGDALRRGDHRAERLGDAAREAPREHHQRAERERGDAGDAHPHHRLQRAHAPERVGDGRAVARAAAREHPLERLVRAPGAPLGEHLRLAGLEAHAERGRLARGHRPDVEGASERGGVERVGPGARRAGGRAGRRRRPGRSCAGPRRAPSPRPRAARCRPRPRRSRARRGPRRGTPSPGWSARATAGARAPCAAARAA